MEKNALRVFSVLTLTLATTVGNPLLASTGCSKSLEKISIRKMKKEDVALILRVEGGLPTRRAWDQLAFLKFGSSPNSIVLLALDPQTEKVLGHLIADAPGDGTVRLVRLVVESKSQRQGVGTQLLDALKTSLKAAGATRLVMEVPETLFAAQALLRKAGIPAIGVKPGYFIETGEDAYLFELKLSVPRKAEDGSVPEYKVSHNHKDDTLRKLQLTSNLGEVIYREHLDSYRIEQVNYGSDETSRMARKLLVEALAAEAKEDGKKFLTIETDYFDFAEREFFKSEGFIPDHIETDDVNEFYILRYTL